MYNTLSALRRDRLSGFGKFHNFILILPFTYDWDAHDLSGKHGK